MTPILQEIDAAFEKASKGSEPRDWIPDPEIDYRDAVKCSVCGACDIARADDDDPNSYCTSCAVNSEKAFKAILVNHYPALRDEILRLQAIEKGVQAMTLPEAPSPRRLKENAMSDIEIEIKKTHRYNVARLKVYANVRYWEDAKVNGVEDEQGDLIPFRNGDTWEPVIDPAAGEIVDWPKGTTADIHYKVSDAGEYALIDAADEEVIRIDGYVPSIMCPEGGGFGDYIIMKVDGEGLISNWRVDLEDFTNDPHP